MSLFLQAHTVAVTVYLIIIWLRNGGGPAAAAANVKKRYRVSLWDPRRTFDMVAVINRFSLIHAQQNSYRREREGTRLNKLFGKMFASPKIDTKAKHHISLVALVFLFFPQKFLILN